MAQGPIETPRRRTCAVMQHHEYLAETNPTYRDSRRMLEVNTRGARLATRTTVVRIPVVVHVLHHTDAENIPDAQIVSQIAALNRDYRMRNDDRSQVPAPFKPFAVDTLIEFALAVRDPQGNPTTGITRTRTSQAVFPYNRFDRAATDKLDKLVKVDGVGIRAWPRDSYLNMWTCTIEGGLLGYAQFPGGPAATDGVVMLNTAFGSGGITQAPYNLGRTATHEVGHWLNLLHIWGNDDGGCNASDNVDDTPNQDGSNDSSVRLSSFPKLSCSNGPHGDMFMNYMDYVDDDTMMMFTAGQLKRMNATLAGPRAPLLNSAGLTPPDTTRLVAERAIRRERPDLAAALALAEPGAAPSTAFDGVSWVPS